MEFDYIKQNDEYGYWELKDYKSYEESIDYFANNYYQEDTGSYQSKYNEDELRDIRNRCERKEYILKKHSTISPLFGEKIRLLDVGCGEGWTLSYFAEKGYEVTGIDLSSYGLKKNNPHMLKRLMQGDCKKVLTTFIEEGRKFDIICTDMMLDMTKRPEEVVLLFKELLTTDGIMWINVSNNYSVLQMKLLEDNKLERDFWLDKEGHPVYFNTESIRNMCEKCGLERVAVYGESFVDFNLVNENTNYYKNGTVGRNCYEAKMYLENMMQEISLEKTIEIYRLLGEMGFGRTTTGIFRIKDN